MNDRWEGPCECRDDGNCEHNGIVNPHAIGGRLAYGDPNIGDDDRVLLGEVENLRAEAHRTIRPPTTSETANPAQKETTVNDKTETELRIQALNLATAVMRDRIAANTGGTGPAADIVDEASDYLEFLRGETAADIADTDSDPLSVEVARSATLATVRKERDYAHKLLRRIRRVVTLHGDLLRSVNAAVALESEGDIADAERLAAGDE